MSCTHLSKHVLQSKYFTASSIIFHSLDRAVTVLTAHGCPNNSDRLPVRVGESESGALDVAGPVAASALSLPHTVAAFAPCLEAAINIE